MTLRDRFRAWLGITTAPAATPARSPMNISSTALAFAGPPEKINPFQLPTPAKGVLPPGNKGMAADSQITSAFANAMVGIWGEGLQFYGYPYLAELTQRPEYRRPSETIAMEMTRKWIKFVTSGEEDAPASDAPIVEAVVKITQKSKDAKLKKLDDAFKRLKIREAFRRGAEQDGFFGRSHIYIDTGDTDNRPELETPLIIDKRKIRKGGLKRLQNVEPMWAYPSAYNSSDPLRPDYFTPTSWWVMGKQIHSSRLIRFCAREVPDILKPAYSFGGLSLSQILKPYVDNWLQTRQSVNGMIHTYSTMVLKTNMAAVLQGGGADSLVSRAQLYNLTRDNRGLQMVDKETEEVENISAPLTDLPLLQAQSQEHMAAVTGIPITILLGITPSGLNASSEGEIRTFYAWIEDMQEAIFRDPLQRLLEIVQISEFGEIDPNIGFEFEPLWASSEVEEADIDDKKSQTAERYVNMGAVAPEEVRKVLVNAPESPYAGLDVDDVPDPPAPEPDPFGNGDAPSGNEGNDE